MRYLIKLILGTIKTCPEILDSTGNKSQPFTRKNYWKHFEQRVLVHILLTLFTAIGKQHWMTEYKQKEFVEMSIFLNR